MAQQAVEPDTFGTVNGATIRVASAGYFDYVDPKPDQFRFYDIALGLSREGRYANQTLYHYTVAMHLLNCLEVAKRDNVDDDTKRALLMHDAAEAFYRDLPKPLKIILPEYSVLENRGQRVICEKYGVKTDDVAINHYVKQVDREMLIAEKTELFTYDGQKWQDEDLVRKHKINLFLEGIEDITELAHLFTVAARDLGINTEI